MPKKREPFIWLQENEAVGKADCGCQLEIIDDNPAFFMCDKHASTTKKAVSPNYAKLQEEHAQVLADMKELATDHNILSGQVSRCQQAFRCLGSLQSVLENRATTLSWNLTEDQEIDDTTMAIFEAINDLRKQSSIIETVRDLFSTALCANH